MPKLPERVGATMRTTASHAANSLNGSRILSCMCDGGWHQRRLSFAWRRASDAGCSRHLINRPDHVQSGFGIVFELVSQDALAAVERVFQADGFSSHATELLGGEEWLSEK